MADVKLGPAPVNISGVRAGDANEFQITLTRGGQPIDLTGLTVMAQARSTPLDTDELDAVIDVLDETHGLISLRWPGDDVRTWIGTAESRTGVWDLQTSNGSGDPNTLIGGTFEADMDVTR